VVRLSRSDQAFGTEPTRNVLRSNWNLLHRPHTLNPCSGLDCEKSLRSSYTVLNPRRNRNPKTQICWQCIASLYSGYEMLGLHVRSTIRPTTPYTLHPTPYTPHPTPYTLHPTPYTLYPTLYTPHRLGPTDTAHFTCGLPKQSLWIHIQVTDKIPGLPRCRVNMAHRRQSRPDSGLGFQVKVLKTC
jgi:hypothetical protein